MASIITLRDLITDWSSPALTPVDSENLLDKVGIDDFTIREADDSIEFGLTLLIETELGFHIPGVEGLGMYVALREEDVTAIEINSVIASSGTNIQCPDLDISLRFPPNILRPVSKEGEAFVPLEDPSAPYAIELEGIALSYEMGNGLRFGSESEPPSLSLPPAMIGDTGIIIESEAIQFYFDRGTPPPPDQTEGFQGIFMEQVQLHFPRDLAEIIPDGVCFENCTIGTGGFSGSISVDWATLYGGNLFGLQLGLRHFGLTFQQNALTEASIIGELTLPFFDAPVEVEIGIDVGGGFTVGLSSTSALKTIRKDGILELELESLGFEVQDGDFTAMLSGEVKPTLGDLDWPSFKMEELSIDSHGNVNFDGGWIDLRDQYSLDFYGFQMEITQLGFGKSDDGGKWIGFSGSLNLVDGLSAGASVEGLRITWYDDDRLPKVTFEGVGVEFEIPDVLHFQGEVSYRELPNNVHRFDGDIKLELITLDMEIDAQLVVGFDQDHGYSFFAIFLSTELPAGIPLWSTGLALYGMAGLFAINMMPDKAPDEEWYGIEPGAGWYKKDPIGVAELSKWDNERAALALGAGVTIGTLADNGFIFSGKLLLVISFPGPVLLIEGKANLLRERSKLDEEPIFRALAVLDGREGTFLVGLDAQFKYDEEEGRVIDISGGSEAYFSMSDPGAWHLYLGEQEPKEKRIRAEILSFIEANAYFMLDADRLAMGAWIGFDKRWTFGPVRLVLQAWIEGNTIVSWKPVHFHGDLWLHGAFELKVFGFGLGISADALFACDVFDPYHILAHLSYHVNLPWPLPDFGGTIELEWGPEPVLPPLPLPLQEVAVEHLLDTASWPLQRGSLLLPNYNPEDDGFRHDPDRTPEEIAALRPDASDAIAEFIPFVPMDCRPHITFSRPVHDDTGGDNKGGLPPRPARERIGDPENDEGPLSVRYGLQGIALHKWDSVEDWVKVAQSGSIEDTDGDSDDTAEVPEIEASWAPVPNADGESIAQTKLWLWSKTPFDYTRHGGHSWTEWFTDHFQSYPCPAALPDDITMWVDFQREALGRTYGSPWWHPREPRSCFYWDTPSEPTVVITTPVEGRSRAVHLGNNAEHLEARVTIYFSEPAKRVQVVVCDGQGVTATGYDEVGAEIDDAVDYRPHKHLVEIQHPDESCRVASVEIQGHSATFLYAVGVTVGPTWLEIEDRREAIVRLENEFARWSHKDEVLEPHTVYRLAISTTIEYLGEAELLGEDGTYKQTEFAFFRTAGPPGLAHLSLPPGTANVEESARRNPDGDFLTIDNAGQIGSIAQDRINELEETQRLVLQSGLDTLVPYVDQTIPPTVPASGEKPLLPRPVYRAYDVGVLFSENYVELMYRLARRDLGLYLYDNNSRPVRDAQGRLIILNTHWKSREDVTLTESEERWLTVVDDATCVPETEVTILPAQTLTNAAEGQVLEPDTVYEARLLPLLRHEDFSGHIGESVRGSGGSIGDWLVHDEGEHGGASRWIVDGHESISGTIDRVDGPDLYLSDSPDLSGVDPAFDVLHLLDEGDPPRPLYAYRIAAKNNSRKFVRIHGEPDPDIVERVYVIPARSAMVQRSNIWGGRTRRLSLPKPGTMSVLAAGLNDSQPDPPGQWTDFRFSVYLRASDDDAIGVVFRYQEDTGDYYRYSMDRQRHYRRLVRVRGGGFTLLVEDDYAYELDRDYLITIEVIGAAIRIYQDGELVFDIIDGNPIDSGSIGLYCWANTGARFSDVRVDDLRLTAPVYRFQFTTSKYANFFHHMHSFQDETWSVVLDVDGELPDTTVAVSLDEATALPVEAETRGYDNFVNTVTSLSTHQIPTQVEITNILPEGSDLDGDEPPLAFLVQSPEPIDWTRVELRFEETRLWSPKPSLSGIAKLTNVIFGDPDPTDETLSLLLREACDLTGWRVEYRRMPVNESGPTGFIEDWRLYYAFDDEERMPAGTQILISNGNPSDETGPVAGVLRRVLTTSGDRLSPDGTELRLVWPNGEIVHQRHFVQADDYSTIAIRLLRKADGTSFFVVPADAGGVFDADQYRLHLTFHRRRAEGEDESKKLSQAGYDGPEEVVLDIPQ